MADISAQPIPDLGNLLTSYPRNEAAIGLTQAQTGLTGAQTGLTGAQSGLVQMQTQRAALEIQMIRDAMKDQGNPANAQDEQSAVDPTETGVASSLNKKMYVDPMGPTNLRRYLNPALAAAMPQVVQRADEVRKIAVDAQVSRNQNEANDIFQTSTSLANSNAGLDTLLKTTHPGTYLNNVGKAIASMTDKTPEEKDAMARSAIQAAAKYSHQYSGRETEVVGDEVRDKLTKFPVYGAPNAGPTPGEKIGLGEWLNNPQKVTIDNREATIRPKDLGITGYQDLANNKSIKFSVPPPGAPQQPVAKGMPANASGAAPQSPPIPGLDKDRSDFVNGLNSGMPKVKGNQQYNDADRKQIELYTKQAQELATKENSSATSAQATLTYAKRINDVLNTPGLTLGPGSREYAQLQTLFSQWFNTPSGQAAGWQVLNKLLNAQQLTTMVKDLKGDQSNVQLRLGAYETRAIMDNLAANTGMTKEAIVKMLQYQSNDAQYDLNKSKTASAAINAKKSLATFDQDYAQKFPKQDLVDATTDASGKHGTYNYSKLKGISGTTQQLREEADRAGIPFPIFLQNARKSGAVVQ